MVTEYVPVQLPLGVRLRADATFDNFVVGDNALVVEQLKSISAGQGAELSLMIHGQSGVGCSYLLQACCHQAEAQDLSAIYLPLSEVVELSVEILESLESYDLVCIDEMELIAGHRAWEEALFHLFNRLRETERRLIIAAHNRPDDIGLGLPDLTSRLNWGLVLQVRGLNDEQKVDALRAYERALGLNLSEDVLKFLLNRSQRNLTQMFQQLETLDQASLREKRRITIPFVKQVLGWS